MRVRVEDIPEEGLRLDFEFAPDRLLALTPEDDPLAPRAEGALSVALALRGNAERVRITGSVRGGLTLQCGRCLERFGFAVDEAVDAVLIRETPVETTEEVEVPGREMDVEFFDGVEIDIDRLVAEQVFLALPVAAVCAEECRGLCPRCGANLNTGECRCGKEEGDSPFSALSGLKDRLPK